MATHAVTTVAMLEDSEIFRVTRHGGEVDIQPALKDEAVAELSEGLATIDTGLKIATWEGTAPITILTEGNNTLHLKKWAELFFPGKIDVFEELPDRRNKNQLLAYGQLLAKMEPSSHFLIIWDCDAEDEAKKLSDELSESSEVTAFSFRKRQNQIASRGIENMYDEKYLEGYSNITSEVATGKEVDRSISKTKKTEFAKHVFSEGTVEYFKHYHDLNTVVEEVLRKMK